MVQLHFFSSRLLYACRSYIFSGLILLSVTGLTRGQASGFDASIMAGMSAAQIRGDDLAGFTKIGIESGVRVSYDIRHNMALSMELLYSQRGSQPGFQSNRDTPKFQLNYFSIPLTWSIRDWFFEVDQDDYYYKVSAEFGLSYGRLLGASIEGALGQVGTDELVDAFEKNNISWIVGGSFQLNQHWGLGIRYNRSITKLFRTEDHEHINHSDLLPYHLSFHLNYRL